MKTASYSVFKKEGRDAFKKKKSVWRDIVPTRGGEGVKINKMSLLKIPFY